MTLECPNPDCDNADSAKFIGVEIAGVYDGVLFWICSRCGFAFPRRHNSPYRNIQSEIHAEKHNKRQEQKSK